MLLALGGPELRVAGVEEQPVEPGVEAVDVTQGGQVPPASDERLLDGVLRAVGITKDQSGGGVEPGDRGACQHGEGVMIALPRSLHEVPLHVRPRLRAAGLAASRAYGGIAARIVPESFATGVIHTEFAHGVEQSSRRVLHRVGRPA